METLLFFFLSSLVLVACFLFVSLFFFFFSSLFSWLSLYTLSVYSFFLCVFFQSILSCVFLFCLPSAPPSVSFFFSSCVVPVSMVSRVLSVLCPSFRLRCSKSSSVSGLFSSAPPLCSCFQCSFPCFLLGSSSPCCVFFSGFYKAIEHGNQGEPRSSMRPTICSYRSPAETVLSDEEGGAFDSETAPFITGNGNFHFGPWILESFVIKPLVKL